MPVSASLAVHVVIRTLPPSFAVSEGLLAPDAIEDQT